ncbi:hypothetical protein [Bacillus sp. FJAT-27986]|uniref:hypothetical protein n=1 Tax=Bacillus sp. FJAT-27986 TaxID=1743146 RepID=UPI0020C78D5A|nr:hypothetical protein [Bacillus sp. FJAT-27986]
MINLKKFFKIGCLGIIVIAVLLIIVAIVGGGEEESVSTGNTSDTKTTETQKTDDGTKTIDASSQQVTAQGLKVGLGDIKIEENEIQVGINVQNTTDGVLQFYPDQGSAVIGDMQLDANMFLTDGDVSGEIQGGVKKEGVLEFLAPDGKTIDVNSVKEIKLILGDVTTEDFMNSEDVSFTIPVK